MFSSLTTAFVRSATTRGSLQLFQKKATCFTGLRLFSDEDGSTGKPSGSVKWFDATKGFGFIVPSDGSGDVFVHHSAVYKDGFRSLKEGEEVEFNIVQDGDRRRAEDVTGPGGAEVEGTPSQRYNDNDNEPSNWN
eukprot:CAMPEP_0197830170 /NCGR_PEP_ID=MMETSP1437-20131217/6775_1 /TAXON_ID=49252 ORGANISM="Eucampia antarctica, Strain CCMP1452" /NCGR_SAMPLE_ID=MMETSP1437 /ASSEMBLY_ACC=CAM_ASM_001096 /LENGTH=134 /DNA_ID=CAMNT_0043432381 /DNA_START=71 /DNA_END=475 /DNA_ORIENTATION=-